MEKKREKKRIKVTSQIRQLSYDLKSSKKKPDEYGASIRLALFLGAGASFQSQIPVASGMIRHFKNEIYRRYGKNFKTDEEGDKWLKDQLWYKGDESDYCVLFEKCYESEAKRRSYIESVIERKQPSVGYIVLANLIKYGYIKTIITTNFDSLISLACSNYTDIFPVVYSLGNFASEMTVSSERPRILKIHGDFLFSKLKNTSEDLEKPDENMERQVRRILEEYDGLIIIGYSGGDNSVMSIFEKIPDGKTIYWCGLSEDSMSKRARDFLKSKKGTFVKIEGFDELMQIVRVLIELDNESIVRTFQDRQIEINEKISEFENIVLVDEESELEVKKEETESFANVLDKSREITQLIIEGNQAINQGDIDKAKDLYNKAIELDPNNAAAHNNLGYLLYYKLNRPEEAEPILRKAIELDPNYAHTYHNLGYLLCSKLNRLDEGKQLMLKAIELDPNEPAVYYNLGNLLYTKLNQPEEAEPLLRKAIELDPNDATTFYNLGHLLDSELNRSEEAEPLLRKAMELDPNDANTYNNLGYLLYYKLNRPEEAEPILRKAIELDPNNADAHNNLGYLLCGKLNRPKEAITFLKKSIKLNSSYSSPYLILSSIFKEMGDKKEFDKYILQARKLIKDNEYFNLACLNSILDNKQEAFKYLELALQKKPSLKRNAKASISLNWIRDDERFWEIVGKDDEKGE